jgi:type IV pilus assembly protein PilA
MLARLQKAREEREGGFTLIELLVVIIIIGILAAIAIPVFLNQRQKGYDAQAKSDVRNMATAEETYLTDNPSSYTTSLTDLTSEGFKSSADATAIAPKINGSTSYCVSAKSNSGKTWSLNTAAASTSAVQNLACP